MTAKSTHLDDLSSVKMSEMKTSMTPLETYYLKRRRDIASAGTLSQRLLDTAFTVGVESREIDDLHNRFPRSRDISLAASATLVDLLFTHKRRLLSALQNEEDLLAETQLPTTGTKRNIAADLSSVPMSSLADRNLALTRELVLGGGDLGRPAELIVVELMGATNELFREAHATQVVPQNSLSFSKRK
jgi:hypothetical protein